MCECVRTSELAFALEVGDGEYLVSSSIVKSSKMLLYERVTSSVRSCVKQCECVRNERKAAASHVSINFAEREASVVASSLGCWAALNIYLQMDVRVKPAGQAPLSTCVLLHAQLRDVATALLTEMRLAEIEKFQTILI